MVLPKAAMEICTPLYPTQWEELLKAHPHREFARYITEGVEKGFHIGVNRAAVKLKSCKHNILSAYEYPELYSEDYLADELECGCIAEVTSPALSPMLANSSPKTVSFTQQ